MNVIPKIRLFVFTTVLSVGSLLNTGCGGSGNAGSIAAIPDAQSPSSAESASAQIPLAVGEQHASVALGDGASAALRLSVASASAGAIAHITAIPIPQNAPKSSNADFDETYVASISLTVDAAASLDKIMGFVFSRPEFAGVAAGDISYTLYDGFDCTSVIGSKQIASKVDGTTATFEPTAGLLNLQRDHSYLFVFSVHTPHTPKFWTVDTARKAIIGYAINGPTATLANTISGDATKLQSPESVAITADKHVVALDVRRPANVSDPLPYQINTQLVSYSINDNGNVAPFSAEQIGNGQAIGTSPSGIRLFGFAQGNRRDGAGEAFSIVPSTDERNLGGNGNFFVRNAAEANDGTFAVVADQSCTACADGTEEYSVLSINDQSSRVGVTFTGGAYIRTNGDGTQMTVGDIHNHYSIDAVALDPNSKLAVVTAVPAPGAAQVFDVYDKTSYVLGNPLKRYALPAGVSHVRAIRTDAVGTVYALASSASSTDLLIYAAASNLTSPLRSVRLANQPEFSANGFAISR